MSALRKGTDAAPPSGLLMLLPGAKLKLQTIDTLDELVFRHLALDAWRKLGKGERFEVRTDVEMSQLWWVAPFELQHDENWVDYFNPCWEAWTRTLDGPHVSFVVARLTTGEWDYPLTHDQRLALSEGGTE